MELVLFAGAGPTTVAVSPAAISPDLDLRLDVYDSSGTVIASADPPASTVSADVAAGLGGSITIDLGTAGTYFIRVDGVGFANPLTTGYSDYASLGQYSLTVTTGSSTPQNTSLPQISGQAVQGLTLATSNGSWTNSPTGFSYQWRRCNAAGASCRTSPPLPHSRT